MPRSKGRAGRPWRRVAAKVKAGARICHLCLHEIDMTLPATHPMSFTVDHVVPLSVGGAARDLANLKPAHRSCNSSKGNGRRQRHLLITSRRW